MVGRAILLAMAALFAASAHSATLKLPVFASQKDAASGYGYAVPAVQDPFKGYVNPCTYRSMMAGLPVEYAVVAAIPLAERDRLMQTAFLNGIIGNAAAYFQRVCRQARFYSMDGPPSDFNTNNLIVYVLLMQDWQLLPYNPDSGDDSYERQYAVEAVLVPARDGQEWVLPADARIDNRVVTDAPKRQREAEQARMATIFDEAERQRTLYPKPTVALGGGELLADLGTLPQGGHVFAQTWATDWAQTCDVSTYANLRAVLQMPADALLPLDKTAIGKLMADAAGRVRDLCPQTRHCTTYRRSALNNPLAPPPPEVTQTECTYNADKSVDVVIVPPDATWTRRGDLTDDARPVLASAYVSAGGEVGSYSDGTLADMRRKRAEAERQQASKALFDQFVAQYAIATWPNQPALAANPFVFQGKTVGLYANFERMLTADSALFTAAGNPLLLTGIPTAAFVTPGTALIAVRVLGTEQVRLPLLGETTVPHLDFVGAHICVLARCAEILAWNQN